MRKEVVATFIFYHGDGSSISCSRFRLYGSGETGRNKAEKARKENNSILAEKYEKEAKKWSESGTNRIAMHGIMGALVSKEAGAGMTKGLTGAGLNALLQKELQRNRQNHRPVHQLHTGKRRQRKRRKRTDNHRIHLRKRHKTGRHLRRKRRIRYSG